METCSPGTTIEAIKRELGLTGKELATHLHLSEVWICQLTRDRALPSFYVLNNLLQLYMKDVPANKSAHRQAMSTQLLRLCSDFYIQQQVQHITTKANHIFQHKALLALANKAS